MSYETNMARKSGAISGSADDPVTWDVSGESGRAVVVLTCTSAANTTLYIQEARTAAELASPHLSLPHKFSEAVVADTTKRVVVGRDPSLPFGKAWVAGGSGNYVIDGGRRANS